jgi:radical SAM superfamily enzyme YgiQ (UPF0313 family)
MTIGHTEGCSSSDDARVRSGVVPRPRRLRVGVLDILTTPALSWHETAYNLVMTKQYASIMPQAVAVWCRQLGHLSSYATYYGSGDPRRRLPDDLDVIFIASYTQASALAYALAKLYRRAGTLTVIGGPHAMAFPRDCLRFFDVVVQECDRQLVADLLHGDFSLGTVVATSRPLIDLPTVEERMPEIRASAFAWGRRPFAATTIPLLASTGCPYRCDFCIDWARPYHQLSLDRLGADLRYVAEHVPAAMVAFHDPNFAVKFDPVLDAIESVPPTARPPYIMEASLSVLHGARVKRLGDTNCAFVAPGVESWADYSNKAGAGRLMGREKVERVIDHFTALHQHVPYLQANFLFGLDDDAGDEPVALTSEFMERTPFVWPVINIPHPFGGTPLFERHLRADRILTTMPFSFYYSPYVVTTFAHYAPIAYYERLIALYERFTSTSMLRRRLATSRSPFVRLIHLVRTGVKRRRLAALRRLRATLAANAHFHAFHEGRSSVLPELYHREYERLLGPFAPLMSRSDRIPAL